MLRYKPLFEAVERPTAYLNKIYDKLVNREKLIKKSILTQDINKVIKTLSIILRGWKIKIEYEQSKSDKIGISQAVTIHDKHNSIIVFINNSFLNLNNYDQCINSLLQVIGHELIHRLQLHNKVQIDIQKKLADKLDNREAYIASKHELMSYAWEIIEEFRYLDYSEDEIKDAMRKSFDSKRPAFNHLPEIYKHYLVYSRITKNKEPLNQLHKYMYEYLL